MKHIVCINCGLKVGSKSKNHQINKSPNILVNHKDKIDQQMPKHNLKYFKSVFLQILFTKTQNN
jgi:hypothetical protein